MDDPIVFPLFGDGGFVNPTPWPSSDTCVWDFDAGVWREKQLCDFDGGWRWFPRYDGDCTCIYNVKLHKQAFYNITNEELVDSCAGPEFVLMCAKVHVLVEHRYFTNRDWILDKIRADFLKLRRELFGERIRKS